MEKLTSPPHRHTHALSRLRADARKRPCTSAPRRCPPPPPFFDGTFWKRTVCATSAAIVKPSAIALPVERRAYQRSPCQAPPLADRRRLVRRAALRRPRRRSSRPGPSSRLASLPETRSERARKTAAAKCQKVGPLSLRLWRMREPARVRRGRARRRAAASSAGRPVISSRSDWPARAPRLRRGPRVRESRCFVRSSVAPTAR